MIKELGHCIAYLTVEDFSTRIFPSSSQETEILEESIATPFFVLCRYIFAATKSPAQKAMSLLVSIGKFLEATGFLLLYYLRGKLVSS